MNADLVIVGGGIIGLLSAYELAHCGIKVTLIDRGDFGKESSWAAGGILSPLLPWDYDDKVNLLTKDAFPYYLGLNNQLISETGMDFELWQCGLSVINPADRERALQWCASHKFPYSCPDQNRHLSMHLPGISQVRTPILLESLVNYLATSQVSLLSHTDVTRCQIAKNKIVSIQTSTGKISTEKILVCTGAWSSEIFSDCLPIQAPKITPVLGQIIAFENSSIKLDTIMYHDGHYLIPRKDGLILAGSTLEYVGYSKTITQEARNNLFEKSIQILPELKDSNIAHHWSGLRPGTINNHPIIGPHSEVEGLYYNCGHFRYGVAMAPTSAMTAKKWIVGEEISNDERQFVQQL